MDAPSGSRAGTGSDDMLAERTSLPSEDRIARGRSAVGDCGSRGRREAGRAGPSRCAAARGGVCWSQSRGLGGGGCDEAEAEEGTSEPVMWEGTFVFEYQSWRK